MEWIQYTSFLWIHVQGKEQQAALARVISEIIKIWRTIIIHSRGLIRRTN
jgi:hypothetical protein